MGAAAIPLAMAAGSFAAAKMSGADTKTALGAGALGGVGGWAAGPALAGTGILGAAGTGASVGGMFGGGGGESANPFGGGFTGGTSAASGGGQANVLGAAPIASSPKQDMVLGSSNPFDGAYGAITKAPGTQEKAQKLLGQLPMLAQMYGMNQGLDAQEQALELDRLKAAAEIQQSAYRPAPSPAFAPGVSGNIPTVSGGFVFGR